MKKRKMPKATKKPKAPKAGASEAVLKRYAEKIAKWKRDNDKKRAAVIAHNRKVDQEKERKRKIREKARNTKLIR